jgi:GDPmannose 4,6-dehydratase
MQKVLITGVSGQDGAILAYQHFRHGDEVYGIVRRKPDLTLGKLEIIKSYVSDFDIRIEYADLLEYEKLTDIISRIKPDIVYHMGAQSYVAYSFENPIYTNNVNVNSTYAILTAVQKYSPTTTVYIAGSSEVYGRHNLNTTGKQEFNPLSPYAISKVASIFAGRLYRKMGLNVKIGILYNHESELRGEEFVTMKIVKNLIQSGRVDLGNLNAVKDWGYAPEYMKLIREFVNSDGDEIVICTGKTATVFDIVKYVADKLGIEPIITVKKTNMRPVDADYMQCDKPNASLTWKEVIDIMIDYVSKKKLELLKWY